MQNSETHAADPMIGFQGQLVVSSDLRSGPMHIKMSGLATLVHTMGLRAGMMMETDTNTLELGLAYALATSCVGLADDEAEAVKRLTHHIMFLQTVIADLRSDATRDGETCFQHFKRQHSKVLAHARCTVEPEDAPSPQDLALAAMPAKGSA